MKCVIRACAASNVHGMTLETLALRLRYSEVEPDDLPIALHSGLLNFGPWS